MISLHCEIQGFCPVPQGTESMPGALSVPMPPPLCLVACCGWGACGLCLCLSCHPPSCVMWSFCPSFRRCSLLCLFFRVKCYVCGCRVGVCRWEKMDSGSIFLKYFGFFLVSWYVLILLVRLEELKSLVIVISIRILSLCSHWNDIEMEMVLSWFVFIYYLPFCLLTQEQVI